MTRKNIPSIKTGILYMYPGKLGSSKFPLRTLYYLTHLYVLFFSSWVHVLLLAQNISSLFPLYLKTDEKFIHHDFASSEVKSPALVWLYVNLNMTDQVLP